MNKKTPSTLSLILSTGSFVKFLTLEGISTSKLSFLISFHADLVKSIGEVSDLVFNYEDQIRSYEDYCNELKLGEFSDGNTTKNEISAIWREISALNKSRSDDNKVLRRLLICRSDLIRQVNDCLKVVNAEVK